MPALSLRWSADNSKLKRTRTVSFNLPAFKSADGFRVCPGAGGCANLCYARQGNYLFPGPAEARELNLAVVRASLPLFERLAISDLRRIKQRTIRLHDSGDFFSQEYFDSWTRIAAAFPSKRFYAYTKSLHLDLSNRPANLRIVQSMGGRFDHLIDVEESHTRIFATARERREAGYMDGTKTDRPAMNGEQRIGFVYHGSRPLSAGMARFLREERV